MRRLRELRLDTSVLSGSSRKTAHSNAATKMGRGLTVKSVSARLNPVADAEARLASGIPETPAGSRTVGIFNLLIIVLSLASISTTCVVVFRATQVSTSTPGTIIVPQPAPMPTSDHAEAIAGLRRELIANLQTLRVEMEAFATLRGDASENLKQMIGDALRRLDNKSIDSKAINDLQSQIDKTKSDQKQLGETLQRQLKELTGQLDRFGALLHDEDALRARLHAADAPPPAAKAGGQGK